MLEFPHLLVTLSEESVVYQLMIRHLAKAEINFIIVVCIESNRVAYVREEDWRRTGSQTEAI